MTKRVIALDIGNVCIRICPERCFAALGFRQLAALPQLLFLTGEKFERGRMSETEFLAAVREIAGFQQPDEALIEAFQTMIGEPVPGMVELVEGLDARGFRPVFFSDTSVTHMKEVRRKFPAESCVPDGIYSFEVHAKKPELAMFTAFEERYGVPDFYFDDRAELIEAARKHGWNAHCFTSSAEVDRLLSE